MISILFFFCENRLSFFQKTLACLETVDLYDKCEKIVCADGKTSFRKEGYSVLEIDRPNKDYNWAAVWSAGVKAASNNLLLYLDCDRVVPNNYLIESLKLVSNKQWVYPKNTYQIDRDLDLDILKKIQKGLHPNFLALDARVSNPPPVGICEAAKNPFSGNVLFTKNEFLNSGGLDYDFEGYGYADLDYYWQMHKFGIKFVPVQLNEYHQWHPHAVNDERSKKMLYYNGLLYCKKWKLKPHDVLISNAKKHRFKIEKISGSFCAYENLTKIKLL